MAHLGSHTVKKYMTGICWNLDWTTIVRSDRRSLGTRSRGITFVKFFKTKIRHKILCHRGICSKIMSNSLFSKLKNENHNIAIPKTANITIKKKYRISSFIMPCRHAQSLPSHLTYVHQGRKLSYKFVEMNMYQINECQRKLPDE
jgi:hypothetical protein